MPDTLTSRDITELASEIAALRALIETEGMRCPYREAISKASNNADKLKSLESRVHAVELRIAAGVIAGGGTGGVVSIIGMVLAKSMGWI